MKAILHSDQTGDAALSVDNRIADIVGLADPSIAFIASKTDKKRKYFQQKVDYYGQLGYSKVEYFDFDEEFEETRACFEFG